MNYNWLVATSMLILIVPGCTVTEPEQVPSQSITSDPLDNYTDWAVYRGDKKGNQYAELAQIHAANVHKLELTWQYRTGDASDHSSMQVNPIIVNGLLYFSTSTLRAVALDAVTGEEVWVFRSEDHNENGQVFRGRSRGGHLLVIRRRKRSPDFSFCKGQGLCVKC